jgi:hypothetical protein
MPRRRHDAVRGERWGKERGGEDVRWGACVAVWGQWSQRVNGVIATMGYEVTHGTHSALPPGQDYGPDTTTHFYTSIVK